MLMTGEDLCVAVINKAKELYFKDTGVTIWKDFPEEYWERALGEYGYEKIFKILKKSLDKV